MLLTKGPIIVIDASFLLKQDHVSKRDGEVVWYQEPFFEDGSIEGTFCHKDCLRSLYRGTIKDKTCKFCKEIEFNPSFRKRVLRKREKNQGPNEEQEN